MIPKKATQNPKMIPVLSSYGKNFECYVRERYLKNISVVGVYGAAIPSKTEFSRECLPPTEVSNFLCYLVFTKISSLKPWKLWIRTSRWFLVSLRQFKRKKSCKQNCCRQVRCSQRMNNPLLDHCGKCPSQLSNILETVNSETVKQQTGIQDLATVHLV